MSYGFTPGSGAVHASSAVAGEHVSHFKLLFGSSPTAGTIVDAASPLPTRDPTRGNALAKGGVSSSGASQQLVAANASRNIVEIANGGTTGIWVAFGSAAVIGQGSYVPAKATGFWYTTAAITIINETAGSAGPVGYTEW